MRFETQDQVEGPEHAPESHDESEHRLAGEDVLEDKGPRLDKTSLFDDICFYFRRYSSLLNSPDDPCCTTLFPLKIIASHYSVLHAFVSWQTFSMRSTGWALRRETQKQIEEANQVETAWSRFRCSEYLEALEALLDALGISYEDHPFEPNHYNRRKPCSQNCCRPPTSQASRGIVINAIEIDLSSPTSPTELSCKSAWRSHATDFLYLHRQFRLRRQDYDRITTSIASLTGIIMGRLGVDEARTAKTLTYVAMFFAPLAWVASVYSIPTESNLGPGQPLFWKYWATALPVMFAVWILVYVWHHRAVVANSARDRIATMV